jgi:3-oxoacyl-(acyl-carrier-protein) synthase
LCSSTNAIIDAFNYIRLGHADVMVTGGSEAAVTIAGMGGFNHACIIYKMMIQQRLLDQWTKTETALF